VPPKLAKEKADLYKWLQTAFELEFGTVPPYMMAVVSIKPGANRVAANLIHSVMMEEMLHVLLVGNLMSSIGGRGSMGPANIPSYPLSLKFKGEYFRDREFDVHLSAFSKETVSTFTRIELPQDWEEKELRLFAKEIEIKGLTIGEFYQNIEKGLEDL